MKNDAKKPSKGATAKKRLAATVSVTDAGRLPGMMTVTELSAFMRVEKKTIYGLVAEGQIPGVCRLGRAIRIHRDSVLDWLADNAASRTQ